MSSGVDEPPGVQNFSGCPARIAAGELEQLAQRDAERGLVLARGGRRGRTASTCRSPVDFSVPIERNQSAPSSTIDGTLAIDSTLLTTVGAGVQAGHRRERRLEPGLAAAALERVEQRRLLAADVGAGAGVDDDVEVEARAEDVAAEVAGRVRLGDGVLQPAQHVQRPRRARR